jgi:glycosyltransferase involved in cell wall biosynthesis
MVGSATCAVVIPCFNEGASIAALVREVRQHLPFVMVVDDGSTDDTSALAAAAGATVINHARNLGKGATLKTGLSAALARGFEWVVTLDGDGQHRPQDLPAFFCCAEQANVRLVVGNRMHNPQAIPWGSFFLTRNAVFGWSISRPGRGCLLRPTTSKSNRKCCWRSYGLGIGSSLCLSKSWVGGEAAVFTRWRTPCAGGDGGGVSIGLRHSVLEVEAPSLVSMAASRQPAKSGLQQKPIFG